jgi:hypothetical protein
MESKIDFLPFLLFERDFIAILPINFPWRCYRRCGRLSIALSKRKRPARTERKAE